MLDYLRIDGIDLHDYDGALADRAVSRVEGLVGLAAPKSQVRTKADGHGTVNRSRWQDSKIVTIEGEVWGNTLIDAFADFDAITAPFERTMREGAKLLTWRRGGGGLQLQSYVKLASPLLPPLEEGAALLKYQVQVEQMDPRAYSQTLQTVVGNALTAGGGGLVFPMTFPILFTESNGGEVAVFNGGKIETPPVTRIYGPVTSPAVRLVTTGEEVRLSGEVASGEYVELDHQKRTVRLNGSLLRMNLLNVPASEFFDVPPLAHTIRLLASNYGAGAHAEVLLRDAYGG